MTTEERARQLMREQWIREATGCAPSRFRVSPGEVLGTLEAIEDDEPVEAVLAAFESSPHRGVTRCPPAMDRYRVLVTLLDGRPVMALTCERHDPPALLLAATGWHTDGTTCQSRMHFGHLDDMVATHEREQHGTEGGPDEY